MHLSAEHVPSAPSHSRPRPPLLNPNDQVLLNSHWTPLLPRVWYGDLDPIQAQPPHKHDPYRMTEPGERATKRTAPTPLRTEESSTYVLGRLGLPLKRKRGHEGHRLEPEHAYPPEEHLPAHVAQEQNEKEPPKAKKRMRRKGKWNKEHDTALHKAVKLIPNLGSRRYSIDGSNLLDRDEMIVECIRRNTGRLYSVKQVSTRMQQIDLDDDTPMDVKASLRGEIVLRGGLEATDFDRLLGRDTTLPSPNQHPQHDAPPHLALLARFAPEKSYESAPQPALKRRRVE